MSQSPDVACHRPGDLRQAAIGLAIPGEALIEDHHTLEPAIPLTGEQSPAFSSVPSRVIAIHASKGCKSDQVQHADPSVGQDAQRLFVEPAEQRGLDAIGKDLHEQPTRQMGGRGPAQVVALQAKSVRVEFDQRCDRVVQRQGFPQVAAPGEADLRPRRAVVGAQPSGRLMALRRRPAPLLAARRLGVPRRFNEADLTYRGAVDDPRLSSDRSIATASPALAQAGQRGAGRVGEPARRSDQFLDGRAMNALKPRNDASQLRAAAGSRRSSRTRFHRFCGSALASNFDGIAA